MPALSRQQTNTDTADIRDKLANIQNAVEAGSKKIAVEITRAANTNAYTGNDAIADTSPSTAQIIAEAARANGLGGVITGATILTDKTDWDASVTVRIYNAAPAAWIADNAAYDDMYADASKYVGELIFPAFTTETGGAGSARKSKITGEWLAFTCPSDSDDLYFQIVISGAETPASGQKFTLLVDVTQN